MKRDIDQALYAVRPEHYQIHDVLLNWARVVQVSRHVPHGCSPIFRLYRTDPHYTDEASTQLPKLPLEGFRTEQQVRNLPTKHRDAIRWKYVRWYVDPGKVCRQLGVSQAGLADLIHDGRSMLNNRSK